MSKEAGSVKQPKMPNGKRPYVRKRPYEKTSARVAAFMANLKKAQATPKEKRYGSERRRTANLNNLETARDVGRKKRGKEEFVERFASLFPAYSSSQEPDARSADPTIEPQAQGGVGTKSECAVESIDNSLTSRSRIEVESPDEENADRTEPESKQTHQVIENTSEVPGIGQNDPNFGHSPSGVETRGLGLGTRPTEFGGAGDDVDEEKEEEEDTGPESEFPKPNPEPRASDADPSADGGALLQQAAELVWQRRQHFSREARREGRQVMRLLARAVQFSPPHSEEEAFKLLRQLLCREVSPPPPRHYTPDWVGRGVEGNA